MLTASTVAKPAFWFEYNCSDNFVKGVHRNASHGSGGASSPKSSRPNIEGDDERDSRDDALDCIEGIDAEEVERNRIKLGSRALKERGESGVVDAVVADLRDTSDRESYKNHLLDKFATWTYSFTSKYLKTMNFGLCI
jgi:hypothetical protein